MDGRSCGLKFPVPTVLLCWSSTTAFGCTQCCISHNYSHNFDHSDACLPQREDRQIPFTVACSPCGWYSSGHTTRAVVSSHARTRMIPNISSFGHSPMTTTGKHPGSNESGIYTVLTSTETLVGDSRQETGSSIETEDPGPTIGIGTIAGYILSAASGMFDTVWILTTGRPLGAVDSVVQAFWVGSVLSPVCLILMVYCENPVWPSNPAQFGLILGHSVGSMMLSVGMTICSQLHSPLVTSMISASSITVSFIMQHTVFAGVLPGNGNWIEIVGAIIATIAIASDPLFNLLLKRRLDAQASWEGQ